MPTIDSFAKETSDSQERAWQAQQSLWKHPSSSAVWNAGHGTGETDCQHCVSQNRSGDVSRRVEDADRPGNTRGGVSRSASKKQRRECQSNGHRRDQSGQPYPKFKSRGEPPSADELRGSWDYKRRGTHSALHLLCAAPRLSRMPPKRRRVCRTKLGAGRRSYLS